MKYKSIVKISFIVALLTLSQSSFAETYWGLGLGSTTWTLKPLHGAYELENGTTLDAVWGLRVKDLGLEGELSVSAHDWKTTSFSARHKLTNLLVSGIGYLPINQTFDVYGKLGIDFWSTTVDYFGTTYAGDHSFALALGAGINVNVAERVAIRAEYKKFNGIGDGVDKGDV